MWSACDWHDITWHLGYCSVNYPNSLDTLFLPRGQELCWKMETLPAVTKSWYRSLSLKKQELKRTTTQTGRQPASFLTKKIRSVVPCEGGQGLTGVVGVWLQTVDHMVVCFQQHEVLRSVSVPDEDVATVRAAHYKVVAPKTRLLNLERQNTKFRFHNLTAEAKSEFNVTIFIPACAACLNIALASQQECITFLSSSNYIYIYLGILQW